MILRCAGHLSSARRVWRTADSMEDRTMVRFWQQAAVEAIMEFVWAIVEASLCWSERSLGTRSK